MKNCGTKTIETDRLLLRCFEVVDKNDMFNNWASDPEVTKFLTWPAHSNVELTGHLLEMWVKDYEKDDTYNWAIVLKKSGEVIGNISAVNVNNDIGKIHMGYCIGRNWWNKGIVSEALKSVTDFFFREVEANKVEARHDVNNPGSGKVMKKCGMKYEGTLRQFDRNNSGICDVACYGILRTEWKESI